MKSLIAGSDDSLRKTFDEEEIFDKLAQYLNVRNTCDEMEKQDE